MKYPILSLFLLSQVTPAFAQSAKLAVGGAVSFEISTISGDITIAPGVGKEVDIAVSDSQIKAVTLELKGDRVAARFDGKETLKHGDVKVSLPAGSSVVVRAVSGDVAVSGGLGANIKSISGDLKVNVTGKVRVETVSGDIELVASAGSVETVSGDATVRTPAGQSTELSFKTTSGDLIWYGHCGKKCVIDANSLSGEVEMFPDAKSSFELAFRSMSGSFTAGAGVKVADDGEKKKTATVGAGDGRISIETFSGNSSVSVKKD